MGGSGAETGAEAGGVAEVTGVVDATDEIGGVVVWGDTGAVDATSSNREEAFEVGVVGDTVGMVGDSFDRFNSDVSVSVFPASPISSRNPNFNSSGTSSPA